MTYRNVRPMMFRDIVTATSIPHISQSVTVGFSGGIDSTVAVLLMKECFENVTAATMWLYDGQEESFEQIKAQCEALGVRHMISDFRREFQDEVVSKYLQLYESGFTPNPCIICNKMIKYGLFLDAIETDYLALGHYAKKIRMDGEYRLFRSDALRKDQSYNLYSLTQRQLERLLFPIGEFSSKDEVKSYYQKHFVCNLNHFQNKNGHSAGKSDNFTEKKDHPVSRISCSGEYSLQPESMGACFLKGRAHDEYLKSIDAQTSRKGSFVDKSGNILGEHNGISTYTIGQKPRVRKKYPVDGMTSPYKVLGVVCGFNLVRNEVIIGEESDVLANRIYLVDFNLISDQRRREIPRHNNPDRQLFEKDDISNDEYIHRSTSEPLRVEVRISQWSEVYSGRCWIQQYGGFNDKKRDLWGNAYKELCSENDVLIFESDPTELMRAPAPGQAAVLYIGDELIGGGIIVRSQLL